MLPFVAGRAATIRQILIYRALVVVASALPWALGFAGTIYGATAAICAAVLIALASQLKRSRKPSGALLIACSRSRSPTCSCCLLPCSSTMPPNHGHPRSHRVPASAPDQLEPNRCHGSSEPHVAPPLPGQARCSMRYLLLAVALLGVSTLGGCSEGVLNPQRGRRRSQRASRGRVAGR